jgi:hypothetical protein
MAHDIRTELYETLDTLLGEDTWAIHVPGGASDCDGLPPDAVGKCVVYDTETGDIMAVAECETEALDEAIKLARLWESNA